MAATKKIDLCQARLDPGSVFTTPEELLREPGIGREEKIEILRRWAYDAGELAVAEGEGMIGGEPCSLDRVLEALEALMGARHEQGTRPEKPAP